MPFWHRVVIAGVLFAAVTVLARLVDWWLARRTVPPEVATRYRVIRRGISAAIVVVGFLSALLVIPGVRAVAGGLLASSAVIGIVVGFASQTTLGNFVAGLLIAITQPVRLGDRVTYAGEQGVVEDIALTYTFIRTTDGARLVVPNQKFASDTIRNSTIRSTESYAEVTVQVPLSVDLGTAVDELRDEVAQENGAHVYVSALEAGATLTVRAVAADAAAAQQLERDLRVRVQRRLHALGAWQ
jgi:small-conductance mechanosensitive channel